MQRRTVALVDTDFRRRAAIVRTLAESGLHVEPFEAVPEIAQHWPSSGAVLVEDRDGNILRLIDHMAATGNWLPLIGLSEAPSTTRVVRAILDGAIDYLEWPCPPVHVIAAIAGAELAGAALGSRKLREARARSRVQKLTRREREVLAGVAGGLSNRRIGERLAISPRTVEIHRANMLTKMGAQHTSDAIRIAIEAALVA